MEPLFELGEDILMAVEEENDSSQRHKHLPDNALKNIFKHLSYQDILRCHLICTHMHKYLSEHVVEFARPQLDDLMYVICYLFDHCKFLEYLYERIRSKFVFQRSKLGTWLPLTRRHHEYGHFHYLLITFILYIVRYMTR